ncbi:MAG: leucine-rich repeat protein [Bacteroidaceae bacterium]|nr:leucine-rich repeat protein [Bacteroidaceae bacterium]
MEGIDYKSKGIRLIPFYGCTGLTSITIPEGVTSIGTYAFRNWSLPLQSKPVIMLESIIIYRNGSSYLSSLPSIMTALIYCAF